MNSNSAVEALIREKLKTALDSTKRRIASTLIIPTTLPEPPIAGQGPIAPTNEAFSRPGRPESHKPTENAGERRQKMQLNLMKKRQKVQKVQQQAAKSPDAHDKNAKLNLARTEMSLAAQKLAHHR